MEDINALIPATVQEQVNGEIRALLNGAVIESIGDRIQRENLGELVKAFGRERIYLDKEHDKAKAPILKAGRIIDEFFSIRKELAAKEDKYGRICLAYDDAEKKKIEDARIEAERKAQAERARLEAIETKKREEAARLMKEAEEKAAAAAKAEGAEKARLEAEKAEAERKANLAFEAANKKEEQRNEVQAAPVYDVYRTPAGIKAKPVYKGEVKDRVAFIQWAVANKKFHWLIIDEGKVNAEIKANEGQWQAPGIQVIIDSKPSSNLRMKP